MRTLPLSNGKHHAIVDDDFDERLAKRKWYAYKRADGRITPATFVPGNNAERKRAIVLGRILLGLKPGDGYWVRYRNGDPSDCRRENLEAVLTKNHPCCTKLAKLARAS